MTTAVYLFCLMPTDRLPTVLAAALPEADRPWRIYSVNGIAAVYRPIPLADFHGPEAEAQLQDWNWLEPRLREHETVIEQIRQTAPVLPTRFGALFSSLAMLEALVKAHQTTITAFLEQVADCDEWAVKGLLDRKAAVEHLTQITLAALAPELAELAPGLRYLREQRARQTAARELTGWLREQPEQVYAQLRGYVRARRERAITPAVSPDETRELAWNWALLVPRPAEEAFLRQLTDASNTLVPHGLTLSLSGPWPPYSFCPPLTGAPP